MEKLRLGKIKPEPRKKVKVRNYYVPYNAVKNKSLKIADFARTKLHRFFIGCPTKQFKSLMNIFLNNIQKYIFQK